MQASGRVRARAGLGIEASSFAIATVVAVALAGDERATALHTASVWTAAGIGAIPAVLSLGRTRGAVVADFVAAFAMLCAIIGSYTIGGLALLIPASLLLVAGFLHYLATPEGRRVTRAETGRPQLVGGTLAAALGAFLGLSLSPVALVGYALSLSGVGLLGTALSSRRRRRGSGSAFGWSQALGIVVGLNALAWAIALSAVAIF